MSTATSCAPVVSQSADVKATLSELDSALAMARELCQGIGNVDELSNVTRLDAMAVIKRQLDHTQTVGYASLGQHADAYVFRALGELRGTDAQPISDDARKKARATAIGMIADRLAENDDFVNQTIRAFHLCEFVPGAAHLSWGRVRYLLPVVSRSDDGMYSVSDEHCKALAGFLAEARTAKPVTIGDFVATLLGKPTSAERKAKAKREAAKATIAEEKNDDASESATLPVDCKPGSIASAMASLLAQSENRLESATLLGREITARDLAAIVTAYFGANSQRTAETDVQQAALAVRQAIGPVVKAIKASAPAAQAEA